MNQRIDGEWGSGQEIGDPAMCMNQGRRLHDQAVFAACVRLLAALKGLAGGKVERIVSEECELRIR